MRLIRIIFIRGQSNRVNHSYLAINMNSLPKPTSGAPEKTNYLPKDSITKKGGMTMLGYRQALGGKFPLETSNQLVFKRYSGFVK